MRSLPHLALRHLFSLATALSAFGLTSSASAALLTPAHEAQLEAWLGQGNLDFTNIFTKVRGDGQNAYGFHAAVDNRGPTITVASIGGLGSNVPVQIVGGFNPLSWESSTPDGSGIHYSSAVSNADHTAFIFNLSNPNGAVIQRQNLVGEGAVGSGRYQTYNFSAYGPMFGANFDLSLSEFPQNLQSGVARNYSYGGTSWSQASPTSTIVYGVTPAFNGSVSFEIASFEVYTLAPAGNQDSPVPEDGNMIALTGVAIAGLFALRRR